MAEKGFKYCNGSSKWSRTSEKLWLDYCLLCHSSKWFSLLNLSTLIVAQLRLVKISKNNWRIFEWCSLYGIVPCNFCKIRCDQTGLITLAFSFLVTQRSFFSIKMINLGPDFGITPYLALSKVLNLNLVGRLEFKAKSSVFEVLKQTLKFFSLFLPLFLVLAVLEKNG